MDVRFHGDLCCHVMFGCGISRLFRNYLNQNIFSVYVKLRMLSSCVVVISTIIIKKCLCWCVYVASVSKDGNTLLDVFVKTNVTIHEQALLIFEDQTDERL